MTNQKHQSGGRRSATRAPRDEATTTSGGRYAYGAGPVITDETENDVDADIETAKAERLLALARIQARR